MMKSIEFTRIMWIDGQILIEANIKEIKNE